MGDVKGLMSACRGLKPEGVWPALEESFLAFPLSRREAYTPRPSPGVEEEEEEAERLREALRRRGQELFLIVELARALAERAGQLDHRTEPPERETEERPGRAQISRYQESGKFQKCPECSRRELETPERPWGGQQSRLQEGDSAELEELQELIQDSDPLHILQQAIHSRDQAIRKKWVLEGELEQVCDERDSLSRELITSVRHKVRLSQELEDWQEDVQTILQRQLQTQHGQERGGESSRGGVKPSPSHSPRDHRGLFSLFRKL